MAAANWSTQQLTGFLAIISSFPDEASAVRAAVERIAEAVEAEVVACVADGALISMIGYPAGREPVEQLLAMAAASSEGVAELPMLGACRSVTVPLQDDGFDHQLVVARAGEDEFSVEEVGLLRGMGRVLTLTVRMLRLLESERSVRAEILERQQLMERLAGIQRSISGRRGLAEVVRAILQGTHDLLGARSVVLRTVDREDDGFTTVVDSVGVDDGVLALMHRRRRTDGCSGWAMERNDVVEIEDHHLDPSRDQAHLALGSGSIIVAPVHEDGTVIGALEVGCAEVGRTFTQTEREIVLAFCEHVSLALADARTLEEMRRAYHDSLTGLPNRRLFLDQLRETLSLGGGATASVVFIDLDGFKLVNDTLGHAAGDALLVQVADRIRETVHGEDFAARLGGDEFAIVVVGGDVARATVLAQCVIDTLSAPFTINGREVFIGASAGVACANEADADVVVRNADVAMYRAKRGGKGMVVIYEQRMHVDLVARLELEADLRRAIECGEFALEYQPIIDLRTGCLNGAEALVRWMHPTQGQIQPDGFLPLAEECGLMTAIDSWVLATACSQLAWWHRTSQRTDLYVSVNVSAAQLLHSGFVELVESVLAETGIDPHLLMLEVTESALVRNVALARKRFESLRKIGVQMAIDDFGTGYSSLSYLRTFPFDVLKVDRSFVDELERDGSGDALVSTIVDLGKALGLRTVGEGIELVEQSERLRELGCDSGQGFHLARPMASGGISRMLRDEQGESAAA